MATYYVILERESIDRTRVRSANGLFETVSRYDQNSRGAGLWRYELFATPFQAETALHRGDAGLQQRHFNSYPGRWHVAPATWVERESILQNHRKMPPWVDEPFWHNHYERHSQHFVHVSEVDETMLAFTEDEGKGERDIQTRTKPGRYLKRFFGDVLSDKQIAYYAEWFARGERPKQEGEEKITLNFATTAEEIVNVYSTGPASCMDGSNFDAEDNPTRVYAAGDLAVAYLKWPGRVLGCGEVVARALVWPERKVVGRIYPSPDYWQRDGFDSRSQAESMGELLMEKLRADGYHSIHEDSKYNFNGAKLLKEPLGGFEYVMPYLDNGYRVNDCGDHFEMHRYGSNDASYTDGTIQIEDGMVTCDNCGDREHEDSVVTVHLRFDRGWGSSAGRTWCDSCAESDSFYCEQDGNHYSYSCDHVVTAYGVTLPAGMFDNLGGYISDMTGEAYLPEEEAPVTLGNEQVAAADELSAHCEQDRNGTWWPHGQVPEDLIVSDEEDENEEELQQAVA